MDAKLKRARLEAAVISAMVRASKSEMVWGKDDCALWCADILKEALGYDGAERFRGRYRTRIGARRVLGKGGLAGALRVSARKHRWRRIKQGAEQVGDIGIVTLNGTAASVVCRAPDWFVGRKDEIGFLALQAKFVRVIWSVA
jgi:hypothetical protein